MQIQTIRRMAKDHGIPSSGLGKTELIRAIQSAEGNFDCFGRANDGYCDQHTCIWRSDCLPAPKAAAPKAASRKKSPAKSGSKAPKTGQDAKKTSKTPDKTPSKSRKKS